MTEADIKSLMEERAKLVEAELARYVCGTDPQFGVIFDAERYSLLAGGKRLRPFLTLEFAALAAKQNGGATAVGNGVSTGVGNGVSTGVDTVDTDGVSAGSEAAVRAALPYACAIEMVHTYSLIHDDLPCMDDDDLRRGQPTSHKKFGEANALLAGDALLTKAFETASSNIYAAPEANCRAVGLLARCAGESGMIGGQVLDLEGETQSFDFQTLERLQSLKTGELIRCAALMGLIAGGIAYGDIRGIARGDTVGIAGGIARSDNDAELCRAAETYALGLGRAFQVIDDILDASGDEKLLGKPVGSDAASGKTTFLSFMTIDEAREYAVKLTGSAIDAVKKYDGSETLCALAEYMLCRNK